MLGCAIRRRFVAVWYDVAKAKASATARGWKDTPETSLLDYFDPAAALTRSRPFAALQAAVNHLRRTQSQRRSLYGTDEIEECERVPRPCRRCHCDGWLPVQRHFVELGEIVKTEPACSYDPDAYGCDDRGDFP
jgi:hypothetical protein